MGEIKGSESRCCDLGGLQFVGGLVNVNVKVKNQIQRRYVLLFYWDALTLTSLMLLSMFKKLCHVA